MGLLREDGVVGSRTEGGNADGLASAVELGPADDRAAQAGRGDTAQ